MKLKALAILAVACLALGALSYDASAAGQDPAACLLFPYFNTNAGNLAVITITNACADDIVVRLVFINEQSCFPVDRWIELTGYDTFSFVDSAMNAYGQRGFLYAYVVGAYGSILEHDGEKNCLIGQEVIFSAWPVIPGAIVDYSINAAGFKAIKVTADGKLKLDGIEFEKAPDTLLFPRFFGQDPIFQSQIVLINLTGGQFFIHQANGLVYNDNEEAFSFPVHFNCWNIYPLSVFSPWTTEIFLKSTNHDPAELFDNVGNNKETGWIYLKGDWAWNPTTTYKINHASLYGYLIEAINGIASSGADLPWQMASDPNYKNAMLWSTDPEGI